MAIINAQLSKHADALTMWEDMLQVQVKTLGLEHPLAATTQDNIGCVLQAQGKLPEALQMHEKALKTRVTVLGPEHPLVADTKSKYACLYRSGSSNVHPGCLVCSIASVLCEQGKVHKAISLLSQAHTIYQASYGPEHPQTHRAKET